MTEKSAEEIERNNLIADKVNKRQLTGLGGWLILLLFGVLFAGFFYGEFLFESFTLLYEGAYDDVSISQEYIFHEILLLTISIILLGVTAYNLVLFFRKKKKFIKWYIIHQVIYFPLVYLYVYVFNIIMTGNDIDLEYDIFSGTLQEVTYFIIWVSYILRSQRVRFTFTR